MPDNKQKSGPPDSKRINVNEEHEIAYWTKALGVSKQQLMDAVKKVGTSAEAVKSALK